MDQYIGKMLDNRYELLELIGTGGMANVYTPAATSQERHPPLPAHPARGHG